MDDTAFEIVSAMAPGLETVMCIEMHIEDFRQQKPVPGGVILRGGRPELWCKNPWVRGAHRCRPRRAGDDQYAAGPRRPVYP